MKTYCFLVGLIISSQQLHANDDFNFNFEVTGSDGQKIEQITISFDGTEKQFFLKESSGFSIDLKQKTVYQFKFSAMGYYPTIHTFSHAELFNTFGKSNVSIPGIELVKKNEDRVMFAFGGDVMMGRRYHNPYFNEPVLISDDKVDQTKRILKHIKPYMELADFSAVNLESQVSEHEPGERAPKSVTFYSPPETIDALQWAGIDYVTLGNNHIYDYVDEGLKSTLYHLNQKNMPYSGAGLNQEQALKPFQWKKNNTIYDMLGFVAWSGGFSPNQIAEENKGGAAFGNLKNIVNTVNDSSQKKHATVVQYHGSLEYSDEPTGVTEARLKTAIDQGADLVVAHHPHVTQGFEIYQDKLIAYSLGNFVFDQYFYATPHSYILYVWMDKESFYKAEIVPIYLKGYVPVPATGQHRNYVSNRTQFLSSRRGVKLLQQGGHLSINNSNEDQFSNDTIQYNLNVGQLVKNISTFPPKGAISMINLNDENNSYRFGVNQVNGGDFESFNLFGSDERGWLLENISFQDKQDNDLFTKLDMGESAWVKMKNFRRVFKASSQMTFNFSIKSDHDLTAELYFQRRKTRDKFFDAINGPIELLAKQTINGSNQEQVIGFDFNLPRVGYRSYRVMLKLSSVGEESTYVEIDDLEMIQWQGYFNKNGVLPHDHQIRTTATHIQLKEEPEANSIITISYQR